MLAVGVLEVLYNLSPILKWAKDTTWEGVRFVFFLILRRGGQSSKDAAPGGGSVLGRHLPLLSPTPDTGSWCLQSGDGL